MITYKITNKAIFFYFDEKKERERKREKERVTENEC